jgi:hypothetical protein
MKALTLALLGGLVSFGGCATGTMMQAECEARFTAFPDIFECTRSNIAERSPRILQDQRAKLYLLQGEQLAAQVRAGRISDLDAKVEWQKAYMAMRNSADAEAARNAAALGLVTKGLGQIVAPQVPVKPTVSCTTREAFGVIQTDCR